jgi:release factor glutamine methyltransferase
VRLVAVPGVFRPISDTWLLAAALDREPLPPGAQVLDLCSGSGALAVRAALGGRCEVTAVDVSRRAVAAIRVNAALNGVRVRARRGDLLTAVGDEWFDAIVSNPPYVPASSDVLPARGPERAWDAGRDGRLVLDRICSAVPEHLRPGGVALLVHSSLLGVERTLEALRAGGLEASVAASERGALGPLMNGRRAHLEAQGLLAPGASEEVVVVVRGRKPPCAH